MLAAAPTEARPSVRRYQRHRPEQTALHRVVRDNLAALRDPDDDRVAPPRFVLEAFERYLDCGLLCRGFLRAACALCPASVLIALSCKGRGLCPSCGARRSEDTTEHVMTRVLPEVPLRQWVLSLPFQLRFLVGFDADLFGAIVRIFVDEVSRHHARRARSLGVLPEVHSGFIACPQRFGSTLNLNPHLHLLAIDGVYARTEASAPLVFHALPSPSLAEVAAVSAATCRRVVRLLERRGHATDEGLIPKDAHELGEHERTAALAARQPSLFARVDADGRVERVRPARRPARAGEVRGFSVHAGVCSAEGEVERRRRIVRYCLRPPYAAAQFSLTEDGRVAFQLRHPRSDGATHVVFSQLTVLHKLSALIPAPGRHTVRYFGVLSSASPLRAEVVPTPPITLGASSVMEPSSPASAARRSTWAQLMRRVYDVDALKCPDCGGRLRMIAAITERSSVRALLAHLELNDEPPPPAPRPRGPPWLFDA